MLLQTYLLVLCAPLATLSIQVPFSSGSAQDAIHGDTKDDAIRVAIIGAGAGGSSAAFWLSKVRERLGVDVSVDVFERADYIGGRESPVSFDASTVFSNWRSCRKHRGSSV